MSLFNCCRRKPKTDPKLDDLKRDINIDFHKIPIEELFQRFSTDDKKGITEHLAAERLKTDGSNTLTPPKSTPIIFKLIKSIFGGFNLLLWIAATASLAGWIIEKNKNPEKDNNDNLFLFIVLTIVVLGTGLFGFYQERKSSNIMKSFANMIPPKTHVVRGGQSLEINVSDLVVGDLVRIRGGDKVPADIRITQARGLKVDNSSLTGESEPQSRTPAFTSENPLETKNLALFSTSVLEGSGEGIVILTGDRTVVGRIAALTSQVSSGQTPINKEIGHFIHIISVVAFSVGFIFFVLALIFQYDFITAIIFFMGMVVANVPEGIVPTVTACLTLTAVRMRKKFCLVKNLEAVETLGSTGTICSDKTGTLTQNRMTVVHLWSDSTIHDAARCDSNGKIVNAKPPKSATMNALLRCATLCSKAHWKKDNDKSPLPRREVVGDASEIAIMRYCELIGGNFYVDTYRAQHPKIAEIPFNSANKFQVSVHVNGDKNLLVMKGAPEKILKVCSTILLDGKELLKNKDFESKFTQAYEKLGGLGERVLGFCDLELNEAEFPVGFEFNTENVNFPLKNLRFLGLISMIDPPRPGVPEAVRLCQGAGIKVVMVTGDHPITAKAIAQQVHIIEEGEEVVTLITNDPSLPVDEYYGKGRLRPTEAIVVHGEVLRQLSPTTLNEIVTHYDQIVFARTSPTQKLQIVEAFQKNNQIVGVTGDGVNDAPALRKADIGIAMGLAGTEVSKQAADMILLNDNFASIVVGIEEGRLIFDNLKKSIAYTLTSNIPEIMPFMTYVLLGFPLPLSVVAILMIDLGTDVMPAISFAYEVAEADIMERPPRNPLKDRLVNRRLIFFSYLQIGFIQACGGFCVYFTLMMHNGFLPQRLFQLMHEWDNEYINDVEDSFGQQWSYVARKSLEQSCHAAFLFSIVISQWADLYISKTRKNSLIQQGIENNVMNIAILVTTVILYTIYVPYLSWVLKLAGPRMEIMLVALPFAWILIVYDEIRRYCIRRWPGGLVYRETYF